MASRLVLVRHGRSALATRVGWIDADGVNRWRVEYDAAGIACADEPPAELRTLASNADVVCASDLARAIASAERLAPRRQPVLSPLLRESTLAIPAWAKRRWPLCVWEFIIHSYWSYRILRGIDASADELQRAADAAAWLVGLTRDGTTTLAVTHGVFRRLLARALVERDWRRDRRAGGYEHWSAWTFERE